MAAEIIDGKVLAEALRAKVTAEVAALVRDHGLKPGLAVVLVGDDPASQIYVRSKGEQSQAAGMHSVTHRLPAETTEEALIALVRTLNADAAIHGVLAIPGAFTPSEVMAALELGVEVIKIFPCGSGGGPSHIKALRGPFPDCRFIPTGGVSLKNAEEYFSAGAFALGIGAELADLAALRKNEPHRITEAAKSLTAIVHKHKAKLAVQA